MIYDAKDVGLAMDGIDDYLDLIAGWTHIVFLLQENIQEID